MYGIHVVKPYKQNKQYHHANIKMVIKKMLKGNKKVPAGFYDLNIPFIIIKRRKNKPIYLKYMFTLN